jgi:hypothetical protein
MDELSRVGRTITWFQNSPIIAPLVAFGTIVIALATFTDAIAKLAALVGWGGPVFTVSAGGPRFNNPRLNDRTIDGCILTMKSQVANDPDVCNSPAEMEIASQFCKSAKYTRAINFETKFFSSFQKSYKLSQVLTPTGEIKHVWNVDDRGGFIFTSILCE